MLVRIVTTLATLGILLNLLTACGAGTEEPATAVSAPPFSAEADASRSPRVIATVNGEPITTTMLHLHMHRRSGGQLNQLDDDDKETLLLELVEMELIAQDARQHSMQNDERMQAQMKNIHRALQAQARITLLQQQPVHDDALRALYQERYTKQPHEEFHARHILVENADQARAVIKALDAGNDFATLARHHARGPSADENGDLGWFTADQMAAPFAQALANLKRGDYTRHPVRTREGWHVIQMENRRPATPPSFEQIKEHLRQQLIEQRVEAYLKELRTDSDIQLFRHQDPG